MNLLYRLGSVRNASPWPLPQKYQVTPPSWVPRDAAVTATVMPHTGSGALVTSVAGWPGRPGSGMLVRPRRGMSCDQLGED